MLRDQLPVKFCFPLLLCALSLALSAPAGEPGTGKMAVAAGVAITSDAAGPVPAGKGRLLIASRGRDLELFTYRPETYRDGPLVVVLHGLHRNAADYRDHAVTLGDRFGALVVVPRFSREEFPAEAYQRGGVTLKGEPRPAEDWTFQHIGEIVARIRGRERRPDLPCYLIGHSAGGQFLNRLAAFIPGDARRIVSANPGSLIFPTRELPFPYGFGGLPEAWSDDERIRRYLAAPLTLYLGTADVEGGNLDLSDEAMRQGKNRRERGRACFSMAEALAREKGWPFGWTLVEAEGVGHSSAAMFAHEIAGEALFPAGGPREDSGPGVE